MPAQCKPPPWCPDERAVDWDDRPQPEGDQVLQSDQTRFHIWAHLFLRNQFFLEILLLQRILLLRAVDKNVPLGDKGVVSEQTMQRKETHARGHKGESFGVDA